MTFPTQNIHIGDIKFDHITYDRAGDILYLSVGEPKAAADSDATPEGHAIRFDSTGQVIGVTIVNAQYLLERDGEIKVTIPEIVRHIKQENVAALLAGVN